MAKSTTKTEATPPATPPAPTEPEVKAEKPRRKTSAVELMSHLKFGGIRHEPGAKLVLPTEIADRLVEVGTAKATGEAAAEA